MLRVTAAANEPVLSLVLQGELALETVPELEAAIAAIPEMPGQVEIDCSDLTFIDSTGVSALLQVGLHFRHNGSGVRFGNLRPDLHEMLDMMGFFDILGS